MIHTAFIAFLATTYQQILKRILFLFDPEDVHTAITGFGETLGSFRAIRHLTAALLRVRSSKQRSVVNGLSFENPIGLAAGFDYEARLTGILPSIGFGFQTIGTITNLPYQGNSLPRLGRLPKSKSLMVNKGFKNPGIVAIVQKLEGSRFSIPVGLSIGRTNNVKLTTVTNSIDDILEAFHKAEQSRLKHSYYELNISCPNLITDVNFYDPESLDALLTAVDAIKLSRPVWIKMPIDQDNDAVRKMLDVIIKHTVASVIFGNLQKNRADAALDPKEVALFKKGYFSGKPTQKRSDELIALAYKSYGQKLTIIGCGGVFNAADAYAKIRAGASLVQLITGMIFCGPQIAADINNRLPKMLRRDGFSNIAEAVGAAHRL